MSDLEKHGDGESEDQTLILNEEARRVFFEALLVPPKPNEKALAAARRFKT